jgi:hypothetical protein
MLDRSCAAAAALIALTAACSDPPETLLAPDLDGPVESRVPAGITTGWDLPLMDADRLRGAFPGAPCADAAHREFDFWVGEWNVYGTNDAFFGTNVVTSELDGCLVQEHWISGAGFRGRSLNTFDAETGMWHQDWASQVPVPFASTARLRTSGGIEDGSMVLDDVRQTIFGPFSDTWTWTSDGSGNVIQTGVTETPFPVLNGSFTAVYKPETPVEIAETLTPHCQAGQAWGETRQADFLVGSFDVTAEDDESVGSAGVETDLSNCLFVETFESVGGLEAIAFTYWDAWTEDWFRIWVDSEGERLALRGDMDAGSLVLQGTEGSASGDVEVRVTLSPDGGDVVQAWEVSRDGGATWTPTTTLRYEGQ